MENSEDVCQFGGMEGLEEDTLSVVSTPSQVQLPEDKTEFEANKVYAQYGVYEPFQYDPKLPITKYRDEVNLYVHLKEDPSALGFKNILTLRETKFKQAFIMKPSVIKH